MEWVTVILTAFLSAIMLPFAKGYQTSGLILYLVLGFLTWVGIFWGFIRLLGTGGMSKIYPLIKMLAIVLVVIFGVFAYGEKLRLVQGIGILLGLVSVYLTSMSE